MDTMAIQKVDKPTDCENIEKTESVDKELPYYRYLVVEYCFDDDKHNGEKHVLGSYPRMHSARVAAGEYIRDNVKKMKKRYRFWEVRVQREPIYFEIGKRRR